MIEVEEKIKIVLDSREPEWLDSLFKDEGIEVKRKLLSIGDIRYKNLIIERKTNNDFVKSLFDGRLFTQLYKMGFYYGYRYIIVVGSLKNFQINLKPFFSAIASILIKFQTPVLFVDTEEEFVYVASQMIKKFDEDNYPSIALKSKEDLTLDGLKLSILRCLPGINKRRAVKILEKFNFDLKAVIDNRRLLPEIVGQKVGTKTSEILGKLFGDNHE